MFKDPLLISIDSLGVSPHQCCLMDSGVALSALTKRVEPQSSVTGPWLWYGQQHGDANLYGKTRAEEDARRYLREKEELEKERDGVRNALLLLRKERREAKEELKSTAAGKQQTALEERVSRLEESCRQKEAERVEMELKLTRVVENLRKSLAGGALGAPEEIQPPSKVKGSKGDGHYGETPLPVNCASEMRKRPPLHLCLRQRKRHAESKGVGVKERNIKKCGPMRRLYLCHVTARETGGERERERERVFP
ncbi:hypothetical protein SKAU_G00366320 [Synaphobranchus kaupii]|uniref:Uncharacterized protein n=1 Tax=Synaphobranchus kaupii TaxID=118154 RepID=A0A9Q1IFI7_SYNKA|nr:hypothetical protein SKAU_G00366320 [Synaphobranchus kaupii]